MLKAIVDTGESKDVEITSYQDGKYVTVYFDNEEVLKYEANLITEKANLYNSFIKYYDKNSKQTEEQRQAVEDALEDALRE